MNTSTQCSQKLPKVEDVKTQACANFLRICAGFFFIAKQDKGHFLFWQTLTKFLYVLHVLKAIPCFAKFSVRKLCLRKQINF